MIKFSAYLNEKGQDLVEYTLMLAFCAVLVFSLNSDSFHRAIKAVFDRGVFNDITTHMSAGDYKDAYRAFSEDSRRALANIGYEYGRYYLDDSTKDPVPNELRLATDQQALTNIANFFLGMDKATVNKYVKGNFKNGDYGEYVLMLNYTDDDKIENEYNPYTQTYAQSTAKITFENQNNAQAYDVVHWMMGDYGLDENGNFVGYTETLDFQKGGSKNYSNKRYFFSNEMIDPDGSSTGNTVKRNIRISFKLNKSGTEVIGVKVKAQRNGEDIAALQVKVGEN